MKALTLTALTVATLALTACGGGGNDSPVVGSTPVTTTTPAPTTSTPAPVDLSQYSLHGQAVAVDDKRATTHNVGTNDISTLNVAGKSYTLTLPNVNLSVAGFLDNKQADFHLVASGNHMSYAKYGYYEDDTTDQEYYFYQGQKTDASKIPTTGTATYTGRSVYDCDDCNDKIITGTSAFNVDFGNKTLTGKVENEKATVNLNATIVGNSFAGTSSDGTATSGAFFGANADELAGTYVNTAREFGGSFGAKK